MSEDLEGQLREMGQGYRAVVDRLRRSAWIEPHVSRACRDRSLSAGLIGGRKGPTYVWFVRPRRPALVAAALLAVLAFSVWLCARSVSRATPGGIACECRHDAGGVGTQGSAVAYGAREYRLTVEEMIATQNSDGSWQNDFLTRRNAMALRTCETPGARLAYKKAMRNLRSRGVL